MDPIEEARKAWQKQQEEEQRRIDEIMQKGQQRKAQAEEDFHMEAQKRMDNLLGPIYRDKAHYKLSFRDIVSKSSDVPRLYDYPRALIIKYEDWRFVLLAERINPGELAWKFHLHLFAVNPTGNRKFSIELNSRTDLGRAITGLENGTWDGWLKDPPKYGSA
jgi:hypothetical protein